MGKRSRGSNMSGVAHILKSLGDFNPVVAETSLDSSAEGAAVVEELVQVQASVVDEVETPPSKKAKTTTDLEALDVETLIPHYDSIDDVPEHLQKCEHLPGICSGWTRRMTEKTSHRDTDISRSTTWDAC